MKSECTLDRLISAVRRPSSVVRHPNFFLALLVLLLLPRPSWAQAQSTLRVTVQDETQGALLHAVVTLIDTTGIERSILVDQTGVALFTGLVPGSYQIRVDAEAFQGYTVPYTVRRGSNRAVATLPVAIKENLFVNAPSAAAVRDNGFSRTLTKEEIDALPDDPDELADQLRQIAGPGAQIFINGFRGGRLPPKDQIQTIRFHTNSYAAEYHDAGMVRIEIITKPGMGDWRGSINFGFRDEALNARNAFAPARGPEQQRRFMFSSQGPLAKGKTSLSINADGTMAYDARTIVATTPSGGVNDQIRRPVDQMNANVRLEQFLGPGNTLRAEYARREDSRQNLGVGDFDLPERAFETRSTSDQLRAYNTRVFGKKLFSELKVELSRSETVLSSRSNTPTVRVLDAFTSGGAGQTGIREGRQVTVAQNVDFTIAKHALRAGADINGGWWNSTQQANANGLFTFSSLDDFVLSRPRTYTRRVGDPLVSYSQFDVGWYLQDDFRLSKNVNVGFGVRQELQTHVGDFWNVAPRAAFSWVLGKANVRGGWGIFYDWLDANLYEQTVRVDGTHQIDEVIVNPSYPDQELAGGTRLPASRIQLGQTLTQPTIQQASIGYERAFGIWGQFRSDYMWTRATSVLRSVNVNAPVAGVRPDATAGNITEIGSTGRRASDRVNVSLMVRVPERRVMANVNYQWANSRTHADSALSLPADSTHPDADWGPASQDVRHRLMVHLNAPLLFGVRAGGMVMYQSALPYSMTTGRDDNGDTVFNDRSAGETRNSARGDDQWNATLRLNRSFNLGGLLGGGGGPVVIGGASGAAQQRVGGTGEGGGVQMVTMDGANARYRLDLFVQVSNLFNTTNLNTFVGNQLSPYFGQATSAGAPRRMEIGASISF